MIVQNIRQKKKYLTPKLLWAVTNAISSPLLVSLLTLSAELPIMLTSEENSNPGGNEVG